ncbi:lantibiotic dehydratase [Streptomyces capillispiralis]|uniref:Lantibiotic biosynthesis dehydratase-like protein n=1 Tax=Streptomyces capillispiralis TaxID=68182 RepID=A0A561TDB8_9ACTN|nr:lantibiotic dehydratase [Streptomyces capillispiralis]TWF85122.1 lantibiotic biosynthesis dehydratase-like protein [Streptomyces capillispiralis]GHH90470.1 lantibiotic dehydratase [Streptomyces capillispiralis]
MTEDLVPSLGRWRLWEQFALRGPGFPADGVLRLAPAGLAEAADKFDADAPLDGAGWEDFARLFADAAVETAHTLQDIARMPSFREAVAWQNRPVLTSGVAPFLRWTPGVDPRSSMPRQREELVAHYWQRFCVKNDTIGFFGPVGWGRWDAATSGAALSTGSGLVAESTVYWASWGIDALARTLDADPGLREWIAPRRVPFVTVDGDRVRVPGRRPVTVPAGTAAVLALCDGVRPARAIAAALPDLDVPAVLADLVARRWVAWRLEVPAGTHPDRDLRTWLETVGASGPRRRGLAALDRLEEGRAAVAAARDVDALVGALTDLERDFTELTDTAAVREKSASTAPCRALVYHDSRRSATARLGPEVLRALRPLRLLMDSAGWLTSRLAAALRTGMRPVYERLAAEGPVDLAAFWFACLPLLHGTVRATADELQEEFAATWRRILAVPAGARRVDVRSADIEAAVRQEFPGSGGWTAARYLSPDIMVVADGTEAVARGDFTLVLGELHLAANTLGASLFTHQHPDVGELLRLTDRDHPGPRLLPLLPKEHRARLSTRVRHTLIRPEDYQVALTDFTADPTRPRAVRSADAVVEEHGGDLVVRLPDGARFPVTDVFSHVLTTLSMDLFQLLPQADHTPRVTLDRLVVARETWRLPAAGADFADDKDEARRFVRARRWRARLGLPRYVFVVSPTESRPFYVDFDSPVYVTILAKALRRLGRRDPEGTVTFTEMLPTPEQTWLRDDEGRRYTSELRFVAFDTGTD